MNTPNEIVIYANEIAAGDVVVVPGKGGDEGWVTVGAYTLANFPTLIRWHCVNEGSRSCDLTRNRDELVRVRRPVPTVTIEVELTQDECDVFSLVTRNDGSAGWAEAFNAVERKIRDAIRAARAKETSA